MNKSESISELAKALTKAQADFGPLIKGAANPFFKSKYADLSSVIDVARGPLHENGLSFVQITDECDQGYVIVETVLIHSSGQWLSGKLKMPSTKNDPQGFGSAISYARRYALQAILGLAAEDDDAETAQGRGAKSQGKHTVPKKNDPPSPPQDQERESIIETARKAFEEIKVVNHLSAHWRKHFTEYQADPRFAEITALKDKRKAELLEDEGAA